MTLTARHATCHAVAFRVAARAQSTAVVPAASGINVDPDRSVQEPSLVRMRGFEGEGTLRQAAWLRGEHHHLLWYGPLREN